MTAGRTVKSLSLEWGTPQKYVAAVLQFFEGKIDLDPCSNKYSIVRALVEFCLPEKDGLKEEWSYGKIFVNPPYGTDRARGTRIKHWLQKCADAHKRYGSEVLALIPVATNTGHWKSYVWGRATAVAFLYDTRLKFLENGKDVGKGAPMSCCVVYWGGDFEKFRKVFGCYGAVADIRHLVHSLDGICEEREQPFLASVSNM